MQIYAKYLKSKLLQLIKKLICNQFAKNVNDNVNDKKNKQSKICFEYNKNINVNVKFLQY